MKALIVGIGSDKGFKLSTFLNNRGIEVYGAGIKISDAIEMGHIKRLFTLNPRHKDSMWLMLEIAKPDVIIYCATSKNGALGDYLPFLNILLTGIKEGITKFVLVINENLPIDTPMTLLGVEAFAMISAVRVMATEHKFEYIVINEKDNLLKEVKKFLLKEQEGEIL